MADDLSKLLRLAEQTGNDAILDELVHETAQQLALGELNDLDDDAEQEAYISAIEAQASAVNNDGFERQIEFLLEAGVSPAAIQDVLAAILHGDT